MSVPQLRLPGVLTDRYAIEKEIGSGGMATVFLARDLKHDRNVAIKVLRPELGAILGAERFLSEIKITARLDHPHIITLIDSGAADGLLYYVLPYIKGESLRSVLDRETQLSIDDALKYTRQIGSALDYAHREGVIHRDIKPENVLLHEGEAILTDFGIALAVKEAGGHRLTETGMSVGTPQYMSPEQATGDRSIGPKSDQYSLAAILYEMLTGEPPFGGANSQAVVAKLLTEEPTPIRTVRKTISSGIDDAIAKALSKSPADRFNTIGDFLHALDAHDVHPVEVRPAASASTQVKRNPLFIAALGAAVIALAAIGFFMVKAKAKQTTVVALKDRTQLTFSGDVIAPAMSGDAKQIAFFSRSCPTERCSYSIHVQDVGSTESRTILDGLSAEGWLDWSPDRRNLIFAGTYEGRSGVFLLPVLGGKPRHLGNGFTAAFYAGGDSLLVAAAQFKADEDSTFAVKVTGLSGDIGRTLKVPGGGQGISGIRSLPGTSYILTSTVRKRRNFWQVLDRQGKSLSSLMNSCICEGLSSKDALWMTRSGTSGGDAIVRVTIDPKAGKLAVRQDTVYTGRFTTFSISEDGTKLVVDDGSTDYYVAALPVEDIMAKRFAGLSLLKSSSPLSTVISPNGARILKRLTVPNGQGSSTLRLSTIPFEGGAELPIESDGKTFAADWSDSVTVSMATQGSDGKVRLSVIGLRTGVRKNQLQLEDSVIVVAAPLDHGWVYVPASADRIVITDGTRKRQVMKSAWHQGIAGMAVSANKRQIAYWGWNAGSNDSIGYVIIPVAGGPARRVYSSRAEKSWGAWLEDGSFVVRVWDTPDAVTLTKISASNKVERIGTIPHEALYFSHSADLKRATLGWRDKRADAFMYRVLRSR